MKDNRIQELPVVKPEGAKKLPTFEDALEWLNQNQGKRWEHPADALSDVYGKLLPGSLLVSCWFDWVTVRGQEGSVSLETPKGLDIEWRKFKPYRHGVRFSGRELLEFLLTCVPSNPPVHYVVAEPYTTPRICFAPTVSERRFVVHATRYPASADRWLARTRCMSARMERGNHYDQLQMEAILEGGAK